MMPDVSVTWAWITENHWEKKKTGRKGTQGEPTVGLVCQLCLGRSQLLTRDETIHSTHDTIHDIMVTL